MRASHGNSVRVWKDKIRDSINDRRRNLCGGVVLEAYFSLNVLLFFEKCFQTLIERLFTLRFRRQKLG